LWSRAAPQTWETSCEFSRISLLSVAIAVVWGPACAAFAQQYRADIDNCRASVEQWIKHEADGGRKLLARLGEYGAFQEVLVRWNNGVVQQVTIGPTIGPDGKPAICVVARRHIGTQLSASAGR
jgi:hypothetical protein